MKKKVLIVEDQAPTRKLLSHYLGFFYQVIEKESAQAAIDWLNEGEKPAAIISDILMPEMTGIEFLRQLQKADLTVPPVMMLSGVENSTEKLKCFDLGAVDYMVKPFNPEELRVRISNMIGN